MVKSPSQQKFFLTFCEWHSQNPDCEWLASAPCRQGQGQGQHFDCLTRKFSQVDSSGFLKAHLLVRVTGQCCLVRKQGLKQHSRQGFSQSKKNTRNSIFGHLLLFLADLIASTGTIA
jgi:hypothetical protein